MYGTHVQFQKQKKYKIPKEENLPTIFTKIQSLFNFTSVSTQVFQEFVHSQEAKFAPIFFLSSVYPIPSYLNNFAPQELVFVNLTCGNYDIQQKPNFPLNFTQRQFCLSYSENFAQNFLKVAQHYFRGFDIFGK